MFGADGSTGSPVREGAKLALLSRSNYRYLAAEDNGAANANRTEATIAASQWELGYKPELVSPNGDPNALKSGQSIGLKSAHGTYLMVHPGELMLAKNTQANTPEAFKIEKIGGTGGDTIRYGDQVALYASNNKYVAAENDGQTGYLVFADADQPSGTAVWTVLNAALAEGISGGPVIKGQPLVLRSNISFLLAAQANTLVNTLTRTITGEAQWIAQAIDRIAQPSQSPAGGLFSGQHIALKGAHGPYLVSQDDGGLYANQSQASAQETFTIEKISGSGGSEILFGDVVSLRGAQGGYVNFDGRGGANANGTSGSDWIRWTVLDANGGSGGKINDGIQVVLRSVGNMYLVAEADGAANANRTTIGAWERWVIDYVGEVVTESSASFITADQPLLHGQTIALKSQSNGKYLLQDAGGSLRFAASSSQDALQLTLIKPSFKIYGTSLGHADTIVLMTPRRRFLSPGASNSVVAWAPSIGDSTYWNLSVTSDIKGRDFFINGDAPIIRPRNQSSLRLLCADDGRAILGGGTLNVEIVIVASALDSIPIP